MYRYRINVKLKRASPKSSKKTPHIDWVKLSNPEIQEKYLVEVKNKYECLSLECDEQCDELTSVVEKKWKCLKESILHANETAAPKLEKKVKQKWMTEQILEKMEERKKAKNSPMYDKLNKEIKKMCKEQKEKWYNSKCEAIEKNLNLNGTKKMHQEIKEMVGGGKKSNNNGGCIKDKNGKMLFEKDRVLERWAEYIGELFSDTRPSLPAPSNDEGPPILKSEVERALKNAQLGKAPGDDGITTEMLKLLESFGVEKLAELFNDIYSTGVFPEELLMSVYITLPKQPRATDCANFRTISLMPHALKIFLKIIQARIGNKIDSEVGPTQFGFRPGSGTREAIFCFNILAQKFIEVDQDIYTCFIDYSKAFDKVHHSQLIECLEKIGVDGRDIRIIANLYWHQKAAIRINNELSPFTSIQRGVRQGCVLSPYLFNIYTEFIFRQSNDLPGITIHGLNINNLRYADDTALIADDKDKLQDIVTIVQKESSKAGLEMNVKKTKTMLIARDVENKKVEIKVNNEILQQVDKFIYLGTEIREDIKTEKEIERRSNIAKEKFFKMSKIFTTKRLKLKTKLNILKCYIYSIFTYGCEAWTLSKANESKIEVFEMWCMRQMSNIKWKDRVTNEKVLEKLKTSRQLLKNIQKRKLRYFGHIKRKNNLLTTSMEGKVKGRRPRGRPRNNWVGDIKEWTGLPARDCARRAVDRDLWASIACQPSKR